MLLQGELAGDRFGRAALLNRVLPRTPGTGRRGLPSPTREAEEITSSGFTFSGPRSKVSHLLSPELSEIPPWVVQKAGEHPGLSGRADSVAMSKEPKRMRSLAILLAGGLTLLLSAPTAARGEEIPKEYRE